MDGIGVEGRDAPMVPSHSKIQQFLITQKVPATQDDDILAPIPYTAPPWWRMSDTEVAGTQRVDGIGVGGFGLEVVGVSVGVSGGGRESEEGLTEAAFLRTRMH